MQRFSPRLDNGYAMISLQQIRNSMHDCIHHFKIEQIMFTFHDTFESNTAYCRMLTAHIKQQADS